jgi:hypothetical protein
MASELGEDVEVAPDPTTTGYEFLTEQADPGTAYVRPRNQRTSELEAIFPPESPFEKTGTIGVRVGRKQIPGTDIDVPGTGRKVPLDMFRRGDVDTSDVADDIENLDIGDATEYGQLASELRRLETPEGSPTVGGGYLGSTTTVLSPGSYGPPTSTTPSDTTPPPTTDSPSGPPPESTPSPTPSEPTPTPSPTPPPSESSTPPPTETETPPPPTETPPPPPTSSDVPGTPTSSSTYVPPGGRSYTPPTDTPTPTTPPSDYDWQPSEPEPPEEDKRKYEYREAITPTGILSIEEVLNLEPPEFGGPEEL